VIPSLFATDEKLKKLLFEMENEVNPIIVLNSVSPNVLLLDNEEVIVPDEI
jgi:hypothetical protein